MKIIVFDIETMANTSLMGKLPPPDVAYGATKDPVKRAEMDAKALAEQPFDMPLNPLQGRVCAIGYRIGSILGEQNINWGNTVVNAISADTPRAEGGLIADFLEQHVRVNGREQCYVTWGGKSFDVPYLLKRWALLREVEGVSLRIGTPFDAFGPYDQMFTRRNDLSVPHIDLMQLWCAGSTDRFYKQDKVGHYLPCKPKVDVPEISHLQDIIFTEEGRARVIERCKVDVENTCIMFEAFLPMMMV